MAKAITRRKTLSARRSYFSAELYTNLFLIAAIIHDPLRETYLQNSTQFAWLAIRG